MWRYADVQLYLQPLVCHKNCCLLQAGQLCRQSKSMVLPLCLTVTSTPCLPFTITIHWNGTAVWCDAILMDDNQSGILQSLAGPNDCKNPDWLPSIEMASHQTAMPEECLHVADTPSNTDVVASWQSHWRLWWLCCIACCVLVILDSNLGAVKPDTGCQTCLLGNLGRGCHCLGPPHMNMLTHPVLRHCCSSNVAT